MNGINRLIQVTIGTFLVLGVMLFALRKLGQTQTFAAWDHPLFKSPSLSIKPKNKVSLANDFLKLDVFYDYAKLQWVIANSDGRASDVSLTEYLSNIPTVAGVYLMVENEKGNARELLSKIGDYFNDEQVIFESRSNHFYQEVKKLKPRWIFVATETQISQLQFLSLMYIESLSKFNADIVKLSSDELNNLSQQSLKELQKRHVYWIETTNRKAPVPIKQRSLPLRKLGNMF